MTIFMSTISGFIFARARTGLACALFVAPVCWADAGGYVLPTLPVPATSDAARTSLPLLTLADALAQAYQQHPDLKVGRLALAAQAGVSLQSQARPNPELVWTQEDTRAATRTQSVQINLPIETGGKRDARMQLAERSAAVQQANLALSTVQVESEVASAFFATLATQAHLTLAEESRTLVRKSLEAIDRRVAAGKVSPVDGSKARIEAASIEADWQRAHSEWRMARMELARLIGRTDAEFAASADWSDTHADVPSSEAFLSGLASAPALHAAQSEWQQRQAQARLERTRANPDLTVGVGMKRGGELQRNQLLLSVSVPLPVFDRSQGNVLEAMRREDMAREQVSQVEKRLRTDVARVRETLRQARAERILYGRVVLPEARKAWEAAQTGYTFGKFSLLDVLDGQRTYLMAQSRYLAAWQSEASALADMSKHIGWTAVMAVLNQQEQAQ
ncbi:TolC family protein [Burkholderiaceae bacterium DAT-1]|nr:TolC family protein [Burkholderiaceae bacterium DAT-1]